MFKNNPLFFVLLFLSLFVVLDLTSVCTAEISRDARKHMFRGQAAMEDAKNVSDYQDAVKEFKKAVEYAPHWADAWFNLGIAQEKAVDYTGAIKSFNKYLELNPTATDRDEVEGRIFKLEYRQEKTVKDRQEKAQEKTLEKKAQLNLSGRWRVNEYTEWEFVQAGAGYVGNNYLYINDQWYSGGEKLVLNVANQSISGTYSIDWTASYRNGRLFQHPVQGNLNSDSNSMTLNFRRTDPGDATGDIAHNWRTSDKTITLIRIH